MIDKPSPRDELADLIDETLERRSSNPDSIQAWDQDEDLLPLADAILAAGWRPPLPEGASPWDAYVAAYRAHQETDPHGATAHPTAHHMHALEAALRVYDPPRAAAGHDTEADAWYIRVLDEPVHHTTEHAPANLDWTRDGRLIGVELLGPLRRDRVDQQDLMRHAYLHVEAQKRIKSMALRVSAGAPIGWRDWIREAVWALADGGYLTEPTESTVDRARAEREAKHDG